MEFENFFLTEPELFTTPPPSTTTTMPSTLPPSTPTIPSIVPPSTPTVHSAPPHSTTTALVPNGIPTEIVPAISVGALSGIVFTAISALSVGAAAYPTKRDRIPFIRSIENPDISISLTDDGAYKITKTVTMRHGYFGKETIAFTVIAKPDKSPHRLQRSLLGSYALYEAVEWVKDCGWFAVDAGGYIVSRPRAWYAGWKAGKPEEPEEQKKEG